MQVSLDPIGKSGPVEKVVLVPSNDSERPTVRVPVVATVEHWSSKDTTMTLESALFGRTECRQCHAQILQGTSGTDVYNAY